MHFIEQVFAAAYAHVPKYFRRCRWIPGSHRELAVKQYPSPERRSPRGLICGDDETRETEMRTHRRGEFEQGVRVIYIIVC